MSKSRNSRRREQASYFEEDDHPSKRKIREDRNRRKEKHLATALKSKNLKLLSQLEEEFE